MIFTHRERNLADAVLAYVKELSGAPLLTDVECVIEPYINGREYGHVLKLVKAGKEYIFNDNALWIAFAENRNSDNIVVYFEESIWLGEITDKSYENRTMFSFYEAAKAAEHIVSILSNKVKIIKAV